MAWIGICWGFVARKLPKFVCFISVTVCERKADPKLPILLSSPCGGSTRVLSPHFYTWIKVLLIAFPIFSVMLFKVISTSSSTYFWLYMTVVPSRFKFSSCWILPNDWGEAVSSWIPNTISNDGKIMKKDSSTESNSELPCSPLVCIGQRLQTRLLWLFKHHSASSCSWWGGPARPALVLFEVVHPSFPRRCESYISTTGQQRKPPSGSLCSRCHGAQELQEEIEKMMEEI